MRYPFAQARRPRARKSPRNFGLQLDRLEERQMLDGAAGSLRLDFGMPTSPVKSGWVGAAPNAYSPTQGYGWTSASKPSALQIVGKATNPLTGDMVRGYKNDFRVDLPTGEYDVTAHAGDSAIYRWGMAITAEGALAATGTGDALSFRVRVDDGHLDLSFQGVGYPYYTLAGLAIDPVDPVTVPATPVPLATLAGGPYHGIEGTSTTLSATASGGSGELIYTWDLDGDGTYESPGAQVSHAFPDDGEYTVGLRVTDAVGQVALATALVTVANAAPTAQITGAGAAVAGDAIQFAGTAADPGPADTKAGFHYQWDFGDGGQSNEASPSHAYAAAGTYLVSLAVMDKDGAVGRASTTVTVQASSLATVGLTPGWATFGQALPEGAAFDGLQVGNLVTQTDVKTTWPDGSIKFAIVSANVPVAGSYPIEAVAPRVGSFTPDVPEASVELATHRDFTPLGEFDVSSGTLTVKLTNNVPKAYVVADAVYLEKVDDPTVTRVIDDGDAAFSTTGKWSLTSGSQSYQGDARQVDAGTGASAATWTFSGLTPGRYRVSATWFPYDWSARSPEAPYEVLDGSRNLATVRLDQRSAPAGVTTTEVYTAALPTTPSEDPWLGGPLVSEWRTTVTPLSADGSPHPFLRVLFDTRSYADGQGRLDVTVENTLNQAGATAEQYTVKIVADDRTLFQRDDVTHYWLTRWREVFPIGGLEESSVVPDIEPIYQANALPRYRSTVSNIVSEPAGERFDILREGSLNRQMDAVGGRPEIAPYPDWAARYLVHRDPTQKAYVLAHGNLGGSWPVHLREDESGPYTGLGADRLPSIDERPSFWFDARSTSSLKGDLKATGPLLPDVAHQPSLAYIPYLITGDRYYADEMKFWANYCLTTTWPGSSFGRDELTGSNSDGLLWQHQTRGVAWSIRNLADVAAYLPDDEPAKAYFTQKLENNLEFFDRIATEDPTPLGSMAVWERRSGQRGESGTSYFGFATWENNYLTWAIDHASKQGFEGGTLHRDRLGQVILGLYTHEPEYPRSWAVAGVIRVGINNPDGTKTYFTNYGQIYEALLDLNTAKPNFNGYYGVDHRLILMIGIENGWEGAQDAYDYVTGIMTDHDLKYRAGWAIDLDPR